MPALVVANEAYVHRKRLDDCDWQNYDRDETLRFIQSLSVVQNEDSVVLIDTLLHSAWVIHVKFPHEIIQPLKKGAKCK